MNRIVVTIGFAVLAAGQAFGQGTVQFANSTLSRVKYATWGGELVDAPVGTKIGLFWGEAPGAVAGTYNGILSLPTATIGPTPGVWSAGVAYLIPGTSPGQRVWLKIAGWDGSVGDNFRMAPCYSETGVIEATLGPTAGPGTVIWQSATGTATDRLKPLIIVCPEPSVVAIGTLGLVGLLIGRRPRRRATTFPNPNDPGGAGPLTGR